MEDTSPSRTGRDDTPVTGAKWAAARDAMRNWGTTARFCIIIVVIDAPLLLVPFIRR